MLQIKKREGDLVSFNPKKIYDRIKKAGKGLKVNADEIFIKVITSIPTEGIITTKELDKLVSEISASYTGSHYDYSRLAALIAISSFHKETVDSFSEVMQVLSLEKIINPALIDIINKYGKEEVDAIINHDLDNNFDYFAWRTLKEMYLTKNAQGESIERPQHMYLRVALWVTNSLEEAKDYYLDLANQMISSATPISINSGTKNPQLSSCVLQYNEDDSREGLLSTFNDISRYSADAAGIGLCMSNIRSKDTKISTSGGNAGGLLKYLKIVNEGLRFFNQQGRRPGSAAIYIEPWHKDIFDLLDIKKNTGAEEMRARDIFTALWIPDNFMKAVENGTDWYLFCPKDIKKSGLKAFDTIYGEEYEIEYNKAIELGIGKKIAAQDILIKIIDSQIETGVPYILFKDNVNKKTNHQNIGTIKMSNLCAEIVEYTDSKTTAICTLSSIVIKNYIKGNKFDFNLLHANTKKIVKALNKVIDINSYSTVKGLKGGKEQRALAIGIQGLADVYYLLDLIFTSDEAKKLNKDIYETIYHAAIEASCELVKNKLYKPYHYFKGSPMSKGIFQFDMWEVKEENLSGLWNWEALKKDVIEFGICNSLFTAQMPVASSAKITGSYESFEPIDSNLFNRRVIGGEFLIVNKYLISDLEDINLWSEGIKNEIILNSGSIQNINFNKYLDSEGKGYEKKVKRIEYLLKKYKTVWEIPQKDLIQMSVDRAPFIDQSQSLNIYMSAPTVGKLSSSMMFAWKSGLKTGSYYLRSKAVSTGAKHLAIDISQPNAIVNKMSIEEEELEKLIALESLKNTTKPLDSQGDCFGCSA